jgi:hypothetical protein
MRSPTKLTNLLFGVMLSGLVIVPPALAEDVTCNTCDMITAVNDMKSVITTKMDISNKDVAQSIINYLAQAEQDRYNLMVMWHTDPAPGTNLAMVTGKNLSKFSGNPAMVIDLVGDKLAAGFSSPIAGGVPQKSTESQVAASLTEYFSATTPQAKREGLSALNFASLYQTPSMSKDDDKANTLIKLITDPFPSNTSGTSDKATIANAAVEKAIVSVGLNTFMDMLAKRNPNPNTTDNKSMLQVMENESAWRIQDAEWFKNISISSQEAVLREIAQMMAFNMWMNYQQYRQNEQIAAMMAASVAAQARLATIMASIGKTLQGVQAQAAAAKADAEARKIELEQEAEEAKEANTTP